MAEQLWQHVRVRALRALPVRIGNRLVDLDAAQPRYEYAVRACLDDEPHRRIVRLQHCAAGVCAQLRRQRGMGDADAQVRLQGADAEVEQNRVPVLRSQRAHVRAELGEHAAPGHAAALLAQTQRHAVRPALARRSLKGDKAHTGGRCEADTAACGGERERILSALEAERFVGIAHEFGERTEGAETPLRLGVVHLRGEEVKWRDTGHRRAFRLSLEHAASS